MHQYCQTGTRGQSRPSYRQDAEPAVLGSSTRCLVQTQHLRHLVRSPSKGNCVTQVSVFLTKICQNTKTKTKKNTTPKQKKNIKKNPNKQKQPHTTKKKKFGFVLWVVFFFWRGRGSEENLQWNTFPVAVLFTHRWTKVQPIFEYIHFPSYR